MQNRLPFMAGPVRHRGAVRLVRLRLMWSTAQEGGLGQAWCWAGGIRL